MRRAAPSFQHTISRGLLSALLAATLWAAPWTALGAIHIDGRQLGRTFEGIGGLSAGASSRLLPDYPEAARRDILDLLFKPQFGAGFQHLKVEVGGDVNSTAGTEPSHMRNAGETNVFRGYEWWLMQEARRRNPALALDALEWGAPGWVREFYSQQNIGYLISYLRQARAALGLDIGYVGIRNESRFDTGWIKLLRQNLDTAGLTGVQIVAPDAVNDWTIVQLMAGDPALDSAVGVIGVHYPQFHSSPEAQKCGKPLWASEDGPWSSQWTGAKHLARMLNRNYIEGKMTKTIIWALVSSYYDILPNPSTGPIRANTPWSGEYHVQPTLWVVAHTTQFAAPGWKYVTSGCGYLRQGGSVVTLRSTNESDFSIIIETAHTTNSQEFAFQLEGGLSARALHLWHSSAQEQFVQQPDLIGTNDLFVLPLEAGSIYSLTTTTGQTKGERPIPPAAPFPRDYSEDFERYQPGATPKFFSDQGGAFEVARRADGEGNCLRQAITERGVEWESHYSPAPETFLGDPNWRDYTVGVDARLDGPGFVSLFGRVSKVPQSPQPPIGYWLKVDQLGNWELGTDVRPIASGNVPALGNRWHRLELGFERTDIQIRIDGALVRTVSDTTYVSGMPGIGCGWHSAEFDNFRIHVQPWDVNLALGKPARASSQEDVDSAPTQAFDGNAYTTRWTAASTNANQWLEVDLGAATTFDTVVVTAPSPQTVHFAIQFSTDDAWQTKVEGEELRAGPTLVTFPPVTGRKVRFLAEKSSTPPSISEFQIFNDERRAK